MIDCNGIKEMMSLYLDDEISPEEHSEFEEHIKNCQNCGSELEELQQIVSLCRSITEEELPEDFKLQLHEKLVSANRKESTITDVGKVKRFPIQKYMKVLSSVAAVLLIAVMIRFLYPMGGMFTKTSDKSIAESPASGSMSTPKADSKAETGSINAPKVESKAENGNASLDVKDQNGVYSDTAGSHTGDGMEKRAAGSSGSIASAGTEKQSSAKKVKDKPEIQAAIGKQDSTKAVEPEINASAVLLRAADENIIRNTTITVKVEDPTTQLQKIKIQAISLGAEFSESKSIGGDVKEETGSNAKLVFKMPYSQYNGFADSLKLTLGEVFVKTEEINSINVDEIIRNLETKINDLNNKIAEIEGKTDSSAEELTKLKQDMDAAQQALSNLRKDVQYISLCIEILKR